MEHGLVDEHSALKLEQYTKHINWLNHLLADEKVGDIMINRYDRIFIENEGQLSEVDYSLESPQAVTIIANYLIKLSNRDDAGGEQAFDGMLPDGSRINILLPPASVEGHTISIRKVPKSRLTLDNMVERGILPENMSAFLKALARARVNILVSGSTSSGKTTLLNALSAHIGPHERILTIEDTAELQLQHHNVVRMEANNLGNGITQRDLVRAALRMRGDRIILGELRGVEAYDFLQAINTGHEGSMATIHANNPRDTLMRLELMIHMCGSKLTPRFIYQQIASSLNIIIQTVRTASGYRRISHITEIVGLEGETIIAQDLFTYHEDAKSGKSGYKWANFSSRNVKVQEAIVESKLLVRG